MSTEAQRRASRHYYDTHKGKIRAQKKAWRDANPDKVHAQQKRWRDTHRKAIKNYRRTYVPPPAPKKAPPPVQRTKEEVQDHKYVGENFGQGVPPPPTKPNPKVDARIDWLAALELRRKQAVLDGNMRELERIAGEYAAGDPERHIRPVLDIAAAIRLKCKEHRAARHAA